MAGVSIGVLVSFLLGLGTPRPRPRKWSDPSPPVMAEATTVRIWHEGRAHAHALAARRRDGPLACMYGSTEPRAAAGRGDRCPSDSQSPAAGPLPACARPGSQPRTCHSAMG